jgi:hypothetical protein
MCTSGIDLTHVFLAQSVALVVFAGINAATIAGGAWFGPLRSRPQRLRVLRLRRSCPGTDVDEVDFHPSIGARSIHGYRYLPRTPRSPRSLGRREACMAMPIKTATTKTISTATRMSMLELSQNFDVPFDAPMKHQNAGGQGYHGHGGTQHQNRTCSVDIQDEPSECTDVRHEENPQPDLEIGDFLLRDIQRSHPDQ